MKLNKKNTYIVVPSILEVHIDFNYNSQFSQESFWTIKFCRSLKAEKQNVNVQTRVINFQKSSLTPQNTQRLDLGQVGRPSEFAITNMRKALNKFK